MKNRESRYDRIVNDPVNRKAIEEEGFILRAEICLSELMEKRGVDKASLARRLGVSRAYITQLLGGTRNMTLRTFYKIARELDFEPSFEYRDLREKKKVRAVAEKEGPKYRRA